MLRKKAGIKEARGTIGQSDVSYYTKSRRDRKADRRVYVCGPGNGGVKNELSRENEDNLKLGKS